MGWQSELSVFMFSREGVGEESENNIFLGPSIIND